jgi:hypothetical protein
MAKALNRLSIYLSGLQARFELPVMDGAGYSPAYLEFLRKVVHLRTLAVGEESIHDLWIIERKLLQLLHADSTGSPTWFLDACGVSGNPQQRLLLSNYNLGVPVHARTLQLGLNFTAADRELFGGAEMGEDALRVLQDYRRLHRHIEKEIASELPQVRAAASWAKGFRKTHGGTSRL